MLTKTKNELTLLTSLEAEELELVAGGRGGRGGVSTSVSTSSSLDDDPTTDDDREIHQDNPFQDEVVPVDSGTDNLRASSRR